MKKTVCILILLCCLLTGCANPFNGSYVSVKPYEDRWNMNGIESISVSDEQELFDTLREAVHDGVERIAIVVPDDSGTVVDRAVDTTVEALMANDPITNYAVRDITYEWGKTGDRQALAVQIQYFRNLTPPTKILRVSNTEEVERAIENALEQCQGRLVFEIQDDTGLDFANMAETFARNHPDVVMEIPQIMVSLYPATGCAHVVEMSFFYQTNRDSLKAMKEQVEPVFTASALYVSGDADEKEKYQQLYSFLMERYDYQIATSITPAYSLLRHGVGDSRAFAVVYEAMCRRSGLPCKTVSGTRRGESHCWNLVVVDGVSYHLDLLGGPFSLCLDEQMSDYVWDYSSY